MPDMSAIKNTPEISFIDNKTVEDVRGEMVADYEEYMTQAQGVTVSLDRASVHRMILYAAAAQIYQAMQYIDRQGKQSLLKYSYSDYLDNLALFKGVTRSRPRRQPVPCALLWRRSGKRQRPSRRAPGWRPPGPCTLPRTNTRRSHRAAPRWRWRPHAPKPEPPETA